MQHNESIELMPPSTAAAESEPTMTLVESLCLFRADMLRRLELHEQRVTAWNLLMAFSHPGVVGVFLLRIANWCHARNWRIAFRLIERLICLVTRQELQAGSRIGPGLVLADEGSVGLTSQVRIGANCTMFGLATVIPQEGAAADIVIGDNCVLGRRVRVYGTITLGPGTQIKDNSVVLTSFQRPGMIVSGNPARRRGQVPLELVTAWNPLKARPLRTGSDSVAR